MRHAIAPLNGLADDSGCLIIGVRHPGKDRSRGALASILGSTAWVDAPRAVVMVAVDDEEPLVRQSRWSPATGSLNGPHRSSASKRSRSRGWPSRSRSAVALGESEKSSRISSAPSTDGKTRVAAEFVQGVILEALATGEKSRIYVNEVCSDELGVKPSSVYQSGLKPLREAGRIRARKDGLNVAWPVAPRIVISPDTTNHQSSIDKPNLERTSIFEVGSQRAAIFGVQAVPWPRAFTYTSSRVYGAAIGSATSWERFSGVSDEALTGRAGVWRPHSPPPTTGTRLGCRLGLLAEVRTPELLRLHRREPWCRQRLDHPVSDIPPIARKARRIGPAQPSADVVVHPRLRTRNLLCAPPQVPYLLEQRPEQLVIDGQVGRIPLTDRMVGADSDRYRPRRTKPPTLGSAPSALPRLETSPAPGAEPSSKVWMTPLFRADSGLASYTSPSRTRHSCSRRSTARKPARSSGGCVREGRPRRVTASGGDRS